MKKNNNSNLPIDTDRNIYIKRISFNNTLVKSQRLNEKLLSPQYVIICDIAYISGGTIYCHNKARFMYEQGWDVKLIPTRSAQTPIKGIEKFSAAIPFPFLKDYPTIFSENTRELFIENICSELHLDITQPIIIETGTDYAALWGELLAKKLHAKHIVLFQDEFNKNINEQTFKFYKYKFDRKELACISKEAMMHIFGRFWHINNSNAMALPFECTNSLEDYSANTFSINPTADCVIGYIGRTNKAVAKSAVAGSIEFSLIHPDKSVLLIMFGGPKGAGNKVNLCGYNCKVPSNLTIFITDFIFPLPLQDLKRCDVLIAGAGSAFVGAKTCIPTIRLDTYTHKPIGFMKAFNSNEYSKCVYGNTLSAYLEQILIFHDIPPMEAFHFFQENADIKAKLSQHLDFLNQSTTVMQTYFPIETIPLLNCRQKMMKVVFFLLSPSCIYKIEKKLHNKNWMAKGLLTIYSLFGRRG